MDDKPLPSPLRIASGDGEQTLATVREAYDFLTTHWPENARGPRYEDATGMCLKVLDGHRSTVEAVEALRAAADEAGIRVEA